MAVRVDSIDLRGVLPAIRVLTRIGEEAVAIIVGRLVDGEAIAYYLYRVDNLARSPAEFEGDPWQVVQAHISAEKYGLDIIGVFHTHPTCPPNPSPRDVEGMKRWPYVWVIACRDGVKAWILSGDVPVEVEVRI